VSAPHPASRANRASSRATGVRSARSASDSQTAPSHTPNATGTISTPVSPEAQKILKLSLEEQESLQNRADSLNEKSNALQKSAPSSDYRAEAKRFAENFMKQHYGLDVDADHTYLNEFEPSGPFIEPNVGSDDSAIGHSHTPHAAGTLKKSISLTDLFIHNYPDVHTNDMGPIAGKYGIYSSNDPNQTYPPHGIVDDVTLYKDMQRSPEFATAYQRSIDDYRNNYRDDLSRLANARAQLEIDVQYRSGDLPKEDYDLAKAGLGARDHGHNVAVYPVQIGDYTSRDMLRIVDNASGRTLLFTHGDARPIRAFANQTEAWNDLVERNGTREKGESFANAHFSKNDAQGRDKAPGVAALLQYAADYHANQRHPVAGGPDGIAVDRLASVEAIHGDPFAHLTDIAVDGVKDDANYDITSNKDAYDASVISRTKYIPVIGSVLEAVLGKTQGERSEGTALSVLDLGTLFLGGAEAESKWLGTLGKDIAEDKATTTAAKEAMENDMSHLPLSTSVPGRPGAPSRPSGVLGYLDEAKGVTPNSLDTPFSDMLPVTLDGQTFYTYKSPNIGGVYELYRISPGNPRQMESINQFAVKNEGQWQRYRPTVGGGLKDRILGVDMTEMRSRLETWGASEAEKGVAPQSIATAKAKIEQALSSRHPDLQLNNLGLRTLPDDVLKKLTWLEELDLSGNKLESLPQPIDKLQQLKSLNVSHNENLLDLTDKLGSLSQLTHLDVSYDPNLLFLPATIGRLSRLETLNASHGLLTTEALPDSLRNLTHLKTADFSFNRFTKIPSSVTGIRSLESLDFSHNRISDLTRDIENATHLKSLFLNNNEISLIGFTPEHVDGSSTSILREVKLDNLKRLEHLDLSNNRIVALHENMGDLKSLKSLHLENNRLTRLPPTIAKSPSLESLYLQNNRLTQFIRSDAPLKPMQLRHLDLSNNRLGKVDKWVFNLPAGSHVNVSNNPINLIPPHRSILNSRIELTITEPFENNLRGELNRYAENIPNLTLRRLHPHEEGHSAIQQQVNRLFPGDTAEAWAQDWNHPGERYARDFAEVLRRLMRTGEARQNPAAMKARIKNLLIAMKQDPDLRQPIFNIAEDTIGHCVDRVQLGFSRMEEHVDDYLLEHNRLSTKEAANKIKQKFNLSLVHQLVREKIQANPGLAQEELEVELAYTTGLRKAGINLPGTDQHMQFPRISGVSHADIENAKQTISASQNSPEMISFLAENEPWQNLLKKRYAEKYEDAMAPFHKQWDELEESELTEQKPGQSNNDYQKEKQVWKTQYETAVDKWVAEKAKTEKALFRQLTQDYLAAESAN
jgi:Leucine-rich repeat (LRR) protein